MDNLYKWLSIWAVKRSGGGDEEECGRGEAV
jgi:hypothetical protein